jgi:hypothetical protein
MKDKPDSDISRAKAFLAMEYPVAHTPDHVKDVLKLGSSASTIGRKMRAAAVGPCPELLRSYYRNAKGKDIAIYAANGAYLCQMAEEARVEALANRQEALQEDRLLDMEMEERISPTIDTL